jgi:hypothetical protein
MDWSELSMRACLSVRSEEACIVFHRGKPAFFPLLRDSDRTNRELTGI